MGLEMDNWALKRQNSSRRTIFGLKRKWKE